MKQPVSALCAQQACPMHRCILCHAAVGNVAAQAWDAVQAAASSMIEDGDLSSVWEAAAGDDAGGRAVSPELERAAARLAERSGLLLRMSSCMQPGEAEKQSAALCCSCPQTARSVPLCACSVILITDALLEVADLCTALIACTSPAAASMEKAVSSLFSKLGSGPAPLVSAEVQF